MTVGSLGSITSGEFHEHLQMGLRMPEVHQALSGILRDGGVAEESIQKVVDGYTKALIDHMPAIMDETGSYTSNTLASRITKAFDVMGEPAHHIPFDLAPGQIQYVNNFRLAHCRTEYEDAGGEDDKRHLVRIFLRDTGRRSFMG